MSHIHIQILLYSYLFPGVYLFPHSLAHSQYRSSSRASTDRAFLALQLPTTKHTRHTNNKFVYLFCLFVLCRNTYITNQTKKKKKMASLLFSAAPIPNLRASSSSFSSSALRIANNSSYFPSRRLALFHLGSGNLPKMFSLFFSYYK